MNFLAHIYLSGENDLIKIGNFIADGIRGRDYEAYPEEVRKGILLHREIDTFTDSHPIFRRGTKRLHENYHHYAGVVLDVFYDHFLAKNWSQYSNIPLEQYSQSFYTAMEHNPNAISERAKKLLPTMKKYNWLLSYATVDGISHILTQMDLRTGNQSKMRFSKNELIEYYSEFESEFTAFFEDLRSHVSKELAKL